MTTDRARAPIDGTTVTAIRVASDEQWYEPNGGGCLYRTIALQGGGVDVVIRVAVYSARAAGAAVAELDGVDGAVDPQWAVWLTAGGAERADAHGFCVSWEDGLAQATEAIPDVLADWAASVDALAADALQALPSGAGSALVPPDAPAIDSEGA